MYTLKLSSTFKTSFKKFKSNAHFKKDIFEYVINELFADRELEAKFRDHDLTGDMIGNRECHLAPDILLVYKKDKESLILILVNIGSHANLF